MIEPQSALSQYILFDLSGQDVAVTNFEIDPDGKLKTEWVILGKRLWSDEVTEQMLAQAFKFMLENIEKNPFEDDEVPAEPEPEPDLNLPIWRTILNKIKEIW